MKGQNKIWMNGKIVPYKNAKVHVLTHALQYLRESDAITQQKGRPYLD